MENRVHAGEDALHYLAKVEWMCNVAYCSNVIHSCCNSTVIKCIIMWNSVTYLINFVWDREEEEECSKVEKKGGKERD